MSWSVPRLYSSTERLAALQADGHSRFANKLSARSEMAQEVREKIMATLKQFVWVSVCPLD